MNKNGTRTTLHKTVNDDRKKHKFTTGKNNWSYDQKFDEHREAPFFLNGKNLIWRCKTEHKFSLQVAKCNTLK